jgi:hypothetical protein
MSKDPFSEKLAEISVSAPEASYNMMTKLESPTKDGLKLTGQKNENLEQRRNYKIVMEPETVNSIVL